MTSVAEMRGQYADFDVALERLFKQARGEGHTIPCQRGCDFCCYELAFATTYEMEPIFERLESLSATEQVRIRDRALRALEIRRTAGLESVGYFTGPKAADEVRRYRAAMIPCPLLDFGTRTCSVYADRPYACRAHHIVDATPLTCVDVPEDGVPCLQITEHVDVALNRLLKSRLEPDGSVEVTAGTIADLIVARFDSGA